MSTFQKSRGARATWGGTFPPLPDAALTSSSQKKKTKQRSTKSLRTIPLCYSNTKCTLLVPLTFLKFEKNKTWNFNCVHFSSSSSHVTLKLYSVGEYKTYQTIALLMEIKPTCLELHVSYNWQVTASKLLQRPCACRIRHLFGFSRNRVAVVVKPDPDHECMHY